MKWILHEAELLLPEISQEGDKFPQIIDNKQLMKTKGVLDKFLENLKKRIDSLRLENGKSSVKHFMIN